MLNRTACYLGPFCNGKVRIAARGTKNTQRIYARIHQWAQKGCESLLVDLSLFQGGQRKCT